MIRITFLTACVVAALSLSGCKLVKNTPDDEKAVAADASGDDARTDQRIADTFEPTLLPFVREKALEVPVLRSLLSRGLDAAGQAHGNRGAGQGAAWNFALTGTGTVVSAKLDTRARVADLDTDADGVADLTIQLGPVIRGTALRDFAPFYKFDDFRDQIEFAKLGRALNDRISGAIVLPEGDLIGRTMTFTGVVALKSADEVLVMTPISVGVTP
ncbi:MAG: DUF2291 domain-containing protein [Hoeflea sp.]|uniref:DUF2291 family protein n=1 Tax=Hoeflea sp. TaxID=1940281 RepID=UPI002731F860|nr:DUF2291 domain-containing protein [Hoeflea sp.]MDP2122586.1 DUF2291 domain-containing protein [Hoeflea sp.]MDZ7601598.1 DUF2291 domain-containing protein [Hoeflea sp.]